MERLLSVAALGIAFVLMQSSDARSDEGEQDVQRYRTTIQRYCVTCHNEKRNTANLNLERLNFDDVSEHAEIWEKMVRKVRNGDMPPPGKRQPNRRSRVRLLDWMVSSLDQVAEQHPNPGRPAVHRLNRTEYANAVRDLLGLEIDVETLLPPDGGDFGFDNIADSLNMSPLLMERYMMAASKIGRLSIGDENVRSSTKIYKLSKLLRQSDRMGEDLPFGSRGGTAVRHYFPADGEYMIRVNVESPRSDQPKDLYQRSTASEQLYVLIDGEPVEEFEIGLPKRKEYSWATSKLEGDEEEDVKTGWWGTRAMESRTRVKAGTRTIAVGFLKRTLAYEGARPVALPAHYKFLGQQTNVEPGVVDFEVHGPFDVTGVASVPSREKIFTSYPESAEEETPVARKILSNLARLAYRRPLNEQDVATLMRFYERGYETGGFEMGVRVALQRILVSPGFLFRVEIPPEASDAGDVFELTDLELASRLSFFLWSSIPDEELLGIAERGELRKPDVLEAQVRRMLADDRAEALSKNFGTQWLSLNNVDVVTPDGNMYPEFDDELKMALRRETELFFFSQLQQDRPVTELLSADYTYLNERLARHYDVPNVYGSHFRRVDLADSNRFGLLGHGSILTVTSYATRTSPVRRGKWLMENILGSPPPPPPADVEGLPETVVAGKNATVRERMEAHRSDPTCNSCHAKMDILGFSLENFDGVGKWRTHDDGLPVDAGGLLPDGTVLDSPATLREALLKSQEEFLITTTEKILIYALGRGLEHYDQPTVREIVRQAQQNDLRWSSIILGIVKSTPFQKRTAS